MDDSEGRLLGFYSAALAFSGIGPARAGAEWEVAAGLELSYVPRLSRAERTAGFDKPESSNLAPVVPRARLAVTLPGLVRIEGGWVPPVRVFDARAHLYAVGMTRTFITGDALTLTPRIAAAGGRVRGAITCYRDLPDHGPDEAVYYAAVCHGRPSDDHFNPRQLSAELIVARVPGGAVTPFIGLGARRDDLRFDVGVLHEDGTRDTDQPILRLETTRPFATGGIEWRIPGRPVVGAEVYYAPRSLLTVRIRIDAVSWRAKRD